MIFSRVGSFAVARKTTQVSADASSAAESTPSLASLSATPLNARFAISSETVKPIPAIRPPPATATQPTGGRSRPWLSFVTSSDAPVMPMGFPTTYATMIPSVIGDVYACERKLASIGIPAFARANSGTIT